MSESSTGGCDFLPFLKFIFMVCPTGCGPSPCDALKNLLKCVFYRDDEETSEDQALVGQLKLLPE